MSAQTLEGVVDALHAPSLSQVGGLTLVDLLMAAAALPPPGPAVATLAAVLTPLVRRRFRVAERVVRRGADRLVVERRRVRLVEIRLLRPAVRLVMGVHQEVVRVRVHGCRLLGECDWHVTGRPHVSD